MQVNEMTTIKDQVRSLSTGQKVELIKYLADTLSNETREATPLQFGKYEHTGRPMATEIDFNIAF